MTKRVVVLLAWSCLLTLPSLQAADAPPPNIGQRAPDFTLSDPRSGEKVSLSGLKDRKAIVIVFVGTECPINNNYMPALARLHRELSDRGVALLAINPNAQDTAAEVAAHAKKHDLPFPVLKDEGNVVADQLQAARTPEAFVLDGDRKICYRGRIDDQFGFNVQRPKATQTFLVDAVEAVLAGKAVARATEPVEGCKIGRIVKTKSDGAITYAKHVSRILQNHCQECHRPGQIGPFALQSYEDARDWSAMIHEVVSDNRMPPWHADPKHGKFSNDRRLPSEDKETLLAWIGQGMPRGDDRDLPAPRSFAESWRIGKPDVIVDMGRDFEVPAEGGRNGIRYQYFRVDPGFKEDMWVERAEAKPGNPAVVHHIIVFMIPPGERFNPDAPHSVLAGMAPGDMPLILPPGYGKKVPAGTTFVFQMHYTPTGKIEKDRSRIALMFAKEPPKHRVYTRPVFSRGLIGPQPWLKIPAGADSHKVTSSYTFNQDGHVLGFMPHMHLRGKDFLIETIQPDGKTETVLWVPRFDFGWQNVYRYAEPLKMVKGTKVRCTAHFDNSERNPNNPDPKETVYWGDQTWEEMMIGWMDYVHDVPAE